MSSETSRHRIGDGGGPPGRGTGARRGMTVVEALLVVVLSGVVFVALMTITSSTTRMSFYGQLAGTLQEGSLAMATMQRDLTEAIQLPDPTVPPTPVVIFPNGFKFIRLKLLPDGHVTGDRVRYTCEETGAGNFRIRRSLNGDAGRLLPGIFIGAPKISLSRMAPPPGSSGTSVGGTRFVQITMKMSVDDVGEDVRKGRGSQSAVLTSITRVTGPEGIQSTLTNFDMFTDKETLVAFIKE